MSAIQRWDMFAEVGINEPVKYDMWEAVEGRYVLYADHVAAVAAAEQRALSEALADVAAIEGAPRTSGRAEDLFGILAPFVGPHHLCSVCEVRLGRDGDEWTPCEQCASVGRHPMDGRPCEVCVTWEDGWNKGHGVGRTDGIGAAIDAIQSTQNAASGE